MRNAAKISLLAAALVLPGCLHKQLATPVEDHRVLTSAIAQKHARGDYAGEPEQLQEDLDAMAKQAELLDNIVKGEKPADDGGGRENTEGSDSEKALGQAL